MSKIKEMLVEPAKLYVGETFKIKIKVEDSYEGRKFIATEDGMRIKTEDEKQLIAEWSENNE